MRESVERVEDLCVCISKTVNIANNCLLLFFWLILLLFSNATAANNVYFAVFFLLFCRIHCRCRCRRCCCWRYIFEAIDSSRVVLSIELTTQQNRKHNAKYSETAVLVYNVAAPSHSATCGIRTFVVIYKTTTDRPTNQATNQPSVQPRNIQREIC